VFVDTSVFVCLATRIISRNNKMLFQAVYVAVCCSVLQCVAVCCSVLQCVAVCCSVLLFREATKWCFGLCVLHCVAV